MSDKNFYVLGDDNCRYEGMSKEQIIAAIQEAITTGTITDIDAGVITKIKEQNKQKALSFWVGTQAEYNAIQTKADNCFYIISNSGNFAELKSTVEENVEKITSLQNATDQISVTVANNSNEITEIKGKIDSVSKSFELLTLGAGIENIQSSGSTEPEEPLTVRKCGSTVQITGLLKITDLDAFENAGDVISTLPTKYIPNSLIYAWCEDFTGNPPNRTEYMFRIDINKDGKITLGKVINITNSSQQAWLYDKAYIRFSATYVVY